MSVDEPEEPPESWRAHAVDRVLGPARQKAEQRLQRFLDAAVELTRGPAGTDFSVQDVVERSGQSLRSFYEYFDGKHELLLALLDSSVRSLAAELEQSVMQVDDPLERLHVFCTEFYRICRTEAKTSPKHRASIATLGQFALQLFSDHPVAAMRSFAGLNTFCEDLVRAAVDAGALATSVAPPRAVAAILQSVMFDPFSLLFADEEPAPIDDAAEELWQFLLCGIQRPVPARAKKGR